MPVTSLSPFLLPSGIPLDPPLRRAPLTPVFGAELRELDLAAPLPEASFDALRKALARDLLLVIRDQRLTPAQQLAFTRRFGRVQAHPLALPGSAEVVIEPGLAVGDAGLGAAWHGDLAYTAAPNRLSILQVAEAAGAEGTLPGAMVFASQRAALARLDPWLAHRIEFLEIEHDPLHLAEREDVPTAALDAMPRVTHPVVRVDAADGHRSLFVDARTARRIPGVPPAESEHLLRRLHAAATDPAVAYRHAWRPGDLLVWDNLAVLHRVEAGPAGPAPRLLRTMVAGERPIGPAATTVPWLIAG